METNVTIDHLQIEHSVQWADLQDLLDDKYIKEVPTVPRKIEQTIVDFLLPSRMEELFNLRKNPSWAAFTPSPDYENHLKNLFQGKLIPRLNLEESTTVLDDFFEQGELDLEEEADRLYGVLQELSDLDKIAEEILLNLLGSLRS